MADTETATKPTKEEEAAKEDRNEDEDKKDGDEEAPNESIYAEVLPNRVIVARNHPLSYYVDRSRRILRMEEELIVSGRGGTISMACTLVEVLKRQRIATVDTIATGMNVEPFFNRNGDPRWSKPTSMITFTLKRGEFGKYVSDYQQRKVIEIFESSDKENTGTLTFKQVEDLKLAEKFKANEQQIEESKTFLSQQKEEKLDLPSFIKFTSILIHPLLKDKLFKSILSDEFNINAAESKKAEASHEE